MRTRTLKQLLLYNYRYTVAYIFLIIFGLFFLAWRINDIPNGLYANEINTAAHNLFSSDLLRSPVNPLHSVLQWLSLHVIGVNSVTIRLPSLIISAATTMLLYYLLKLWFNRSTAILGAGFFVSADWFLHVARLGTGAVEFSFWLTCSLIALTKLVSGKSWWILFFALSSGMLTMTPLGIYLSLSLWIALCSIKFFRSKLLTLVIWQKIVAALILLLFGAVIIYLSVANRLFAKELLGIDQLPSLFGYFKNLFLNSSSIVAITPKQNPVTGIRGLLFVRFFELIFTIFGAIMLWKTRVNKLNLIVFICFIVSIIASGLTDRPRGAGLFLIPEMIAITAGVRHLQHRWRKTFPSNPYARVAGLIPMGLLFFTVVAKHYISYFVTWPTQSATYSVFSNDLKLVQDEIRRPSTNRCLVVTDDSSLERLIGFTKTPCQLSFAQHMPPAIADGWRVIAAQKLATLPNDETSQKRALTRETTEQNVGWVVYQAKTAEN